MFAKFDLAQKAVGQPNVRFGSKADIVERGTDVRFAPESGHQRSEFQDRVIVLSHKF
jgi:hypothetical protein